MHFYYHIRRPADGALRFGGLGATRERTLERLDQVAAREPDLTVGLLVVGAPAAWPDLEQRGYLYLQPWLSGKVERLPGWEYDAREVHAHAFWGTNFDVDSNPDAARPGWFRSFPIGEAAAEIHYLLALGCDHPGWLPPPPALPDALDAVVAYEAEHQISGLVGHVARAAWRIEEALAGASRPYIAFSGGKDSTAVLALTHAIDPAIPFIWSDDELEYPETLDLMDAMLRRYGPQFRITLGWAEHAGWFRPWRDEPYWREPFPGALRIDQPVERWAQAEGYDLTLLGLRADESRARADHLAAQGHTYWRATGRVCCPIFDWPTETVLHFIAAVGAPLNGVYARLEALGVEPEFQRVGPLPLVPRRFLAEGWPNLLARLDTRYPGRWR
jgi:3'-phosphoadenosine 5'-phosphosulfate sulfotransferase (PAPS reductase)/FAD synthetase